MIFLLISVPVRGFDIFVRLIHLKIIFFGLFGTGFFFRSFITNLTLKLVRTLTR